MEPAFPTFSGIFNIGCIDFTGLQQVESSGESEDQEGSAGATSSGGLPSISHDEEEGWHSVYSMFWDQRATTEWSDMDEAAEDDVD